MDFLHLFQISSQMILSGNHEHSWEMVYSLEMLHLHKSFRLHSLITPADIPFIIIIYVCFIWEFHVKHMFGYILYHLVFSIDNIHDQPPRLNLPFSSLHLLWRNWVFLQLENRLLLLFPNDNLIIINCFLCSWLNRNNDVSNVLFRVFPFIRTLIRFCFFFIFC